MNNDCQTYYADKVFLPQGFADKMYISVDKAGYITKITREPIAHNLTAFQGYLLPGMPNLHSHAFQRAMAGLTERGSQEKDSFWTWRDMMYHFLEKLTPEDLQAIAALTYMEMLKTGFTSLAEFHYLHHQASGIPYDDLALTSKHVIMAAKETGIAMTFLPVLYQSSGFGGQKPTEGQKRFINEVGQIMEIITDLQAIFRQDAQITLGLAFHSLRAVKPESLQEALNALQTINAKAPIHIHIAEQLKEVDDCIAWSGQRPVEWLLNHAAINEYWCLVHATHMTEEETKRLAQSRAVAGICPVTEANLGDGFFNFPTYIHAKGRFGIGTDSHVSLSMIEELRLLEYGQRLLHQQRAIAKSRQESSVGNFLYQEALAGGSQALGRGRGRIEVGQPADFIVLDPNTPSLLHKPQDYIMDAMIFAGNMNPIRHVVVGGQHVVNDFKHIAEDAIVEKYSRTLKKLVS